MQKTKRKHEQGFTLVAIAAALIVASLLGATLLLSKDREALWQPKLDTKAQLAEINDAIIKFQRTNHRLPCPAPTNQLPESPGFGVEGANCDIGIDISGIIRKRIDGSNCTPGVADPNCLRKGALPVRSLGLPEKYATDKWSNRLTYVASETLMNVYSFSDATGNLQVNDTNNTPIMTDAGYIILSSGADAPGATGRASIQISRTCSGGNQRSGKDLANCDDDGVFTLADLNLTSGSSFFDDQLQFSKVDALAQSINKPCSPPNPASPFSWGGGCSATYTNMTHGTNTTLNNTAVNFAGSADVTCNNGTFTVNSQSCVPQSPCPANTASWIGTGSGCSASYGLLNSGQSTTLTNATGGRTGSVDVSCNNGVITQSNSVCTPNSCPLPWGGALAHGGSVSAYQSSSVTCGNACVGETRTCSYGTLSGSYTNPNCTAAVCSNCNLPWGGSLAHNSTVTAYAASSVGCGSSCAAETRSCNNGTLSGSYTAQSCSAAACSACNLPWGGSIGHGGSVVAFQGSGATGCGSGSCNSETRSCNNGSLSGSYTEASCTASPDSFTLTGYDSGLQWGVGYTALLDICNTHPYIRPGQTFSITTDYSGGNWVWAPGPVETWYFRQGYASTQYGGGGWRKATYSQIVYDGNCGVYAGAYYYGDSSNGKYVRQRMVSGTCGRPSPCAAPWGGTVGDGQSVTAYSSNYACSDQGQSCQAETRTCSGSVLSGSYQYNSCYSTTCTAPPSDGGDGGGN